MKPTEGNEKSQVYQPKSFSKAMGDDCEVLSLNSIASRNTEATSAFFVEQVFLCILISVLMRYI